MDPLGTRGEKTMSVPMTTSANMSDEDLATIAGRTISDLVEYAPGTMTVFSSLGLDMCCGGGHPLKEALALHGIDPDPVIRQVAVIVSESQDR
jgi:iron-sulfur cluster repair protein YtfE (RIC family)